MTKLLYLLIPILFVGAMLDTLYLQHFTFIEYVMICSWEMGFFVLGIFLGVKLKRIPVAVK